MAAEECPKILDKQVRRLHRREVAADRMLVPVGELLLRIEDPADERLDAERHETLRPIVGLTPGWRSMSGLVEEVRGTGTAAAEPVDSDERKELVEVDRVLRQLARRVGPLLDLLNDPGFSCMTGESVRP